VQTVPFVEFGKLKDTRDSKLRQLQEKGTQVYFLDSDKVAYLVYPSFREQDPERSIDNAFQAIKDKKPQDLIIDIRGNGGGDSINGDYLFSYLYAEKFRQYSKVRLKVSEEIMSDPEQLRHEEILSEYAGLAGLTQTLRIEERSMPKPNAFFTGRVFLLVDNGSFSAAVGFATAFRDYNVGTILGYETGGVPISFGNFYNLELRNSGLFCTISIKQHFNSTPRPGDDEHGLIPDIPMTSELLKPYQSEDDPVLAYTLDHIKKTRGSVRGE
jgi:C-terminal processing protease CtpA/Prc